MLKLSSSRLFQLAAAATIAGVSQAPFSGIAAASDQKWPAQVTAAYEIKFNGLKVGGFDFKSTADGAGYALHSSGKVSILLGAMKWSSDADARGSFANAQPKPEDFNFNLKGPAKAGSTKITFAGDSVKDVHMQPPPKIRADMIPVEAKHLKGVLDPFAAVMAMTRGGSNPCPRTIPVYDGKRRIDLKLTPQGQVPLSGAQPADVPTTGIVCRVNYTLVAGHRPGDETAYMTRNQHIEMTFRAVPSANIYVPYQVKASTLLGDIIIFAKRVSIASPGAQELVLNH